MFTRNSVTPLSPVDLGRPMANIAAEVSGPLDTDMPAPVVLDVDPAGRVTPVIPENTVAAESRLTVEQLAALAPGTPGTVMRVTATEVVVHCPPYLEPHRLRNDAHVSGVGGARWVDVEPTEVASIEPQRSAQQIDAVYGAWTRDRSDARRLLGNL